MARKAGQGKEEEESRARQQEEKTPVREEEKTPACHGRGHHVVEQAHFKKNAPTSITEDDESSINLVILYRSVVFDTVKD
ncbi:hypothetical protein STEG23_001668 [Scotinomys teguina]